MTEQQFTILSSYLGRYTIFDEKEGKPLTDYEVVDILKKLNNENKQLKNELQTYQKGNALLKNTLNNYKTENQQIRKTINEMYNNERTQIGKNTLKQLKEALP